MPHLCRLDCDINFLLAHRRPKLDSLQSHALLWIAHAKNSEPKESLFHIVAHLVIVELHDADETFVRRDFNVDIGALRGLTHDLHDVVSLSLALEVVGDELEGIEERLDGRELNSR